MNIVPSPEQQAIIEAPAVPLRIAAGAGTGKTTTIALRLEALILREGIDPEEALGITFTNKAAEELADRLRSRIRLDGREVEVTTYHGFAHKILSEFGPFVGIERDVSVVGAGYVRELLRQALAEADPILLDLTAPGRRVDELNTLANRLADHLASPRKLLDVAASDDEVAARRRELAATLVRYQELKRSLGVVDYGDLIREAHRIVSNPAVAARIRNRYRIVLLDEYQDTNPAQRELLRSVFGDGFPVTAVGDPDQTIYEWRGASLENFAAFPLHFPRADGRPAERRTLGLNRRSDRLILDAANAVKQHIAGDAGVERLEPRADAAQGTVRTAWFHTAAEEARWVAEEVRRQHDEEGTPWSQIALLFRRNRPMHAFREALEALDVPVEVAALGGLLTVPEVADLHAWLRILDRPEDTPALVRLLLGSRFRLGLGDLKPLASSEWPMLEAIDRGDFSAVRPEVADRLETFRSQYRDLLGDAQGVTLVELVRRVLDVTGSWAEVEALDDARRLSTRLNLFRFLDLAESWSPLEGRPSLTTFLEYVDLLVEDRASEELDTAQVSGEDAVTLITVHRAKGLEWDVVFVPAVAKGVFPGSPIGGLPDPDKRPDAIPAHLRLDTPPATSELRSLHDAQEWRTAYVAVTRARHVLTVSGAYWYTAAKPKEPGPLFDTIAALEGVDVLRFSDAPGSPPEPVRIDTAAVVPDPVFPNGWTSALEAPDRLDVDEDARQALQLVLEGVPTETPATPTQPVLTASTTGLVTYASCPRRYYWTAVEPLPRRFGSAARRGVDFHRRVELFNLGKVPLTDAGGYDVVSGPAPAAATGDPFRTFVESRFATAKPLHTEFPFELFVDETTRIRGRIDAIYRWGDVWEIVDFKSGRRSEDLVVQLQVYAVAVDEMFSPPRMRATFAYFGGGLEEVTYEIDEEWLSTARATVRRLTAGIEHDEFEPSPSPACRWCDFVSFCEAGQSFLERGSF